jgi:hypothetical protein
MCLHSQLWFNEEDWNWASEKWKLKERSVGTNAFVSYENLLAMIVRAQVELIRGYRFHDLTRIKRVESSFELLSLSRSSVNAVLHPRRAY